MEQGSDALLPPEAEEKMDDQIASSEAEQEKEQELVDEQPVEDDPGQQFDDPSGG